MKCTYTNCGKKFSAPLELFNGALVCPHCKRELSVVADFKLTAENQELFNLSELYFFRYLSPKSYEQGERPALNLAPEELLELAIDNCNKSAKAGNPKAVFRMGFYNEHYLETIRSENDRIRMAFDYYASLCFSPDLSVKVETGVKPISNKEFEDLKRSAGVSLLRLYSNYSRALKGIDKFDYEKNKQRLTVLYGDLNVDGKNDKKGAGSRTKNVYGVLSKCFNKTRAPLCGLFFLSGAELKSLFAFKKDKRDKKPELFKFITKGLEIRYLDCDENGIITKEREDRYFINFPNEAKSKEILSGIEDEKYVYLYFFNTHGKHQYLSGGQIKKAGAKFAKNYYEQLCRLIDFSAQEYLFYDDDIVMYKKGNNIERCVEMLIDKICGGDE